MDGFVLLWGHVVKCLVNPLTIIEHFDVLENARPGRGQIGVGVMVGVGVLVGVTIGVGVGATSLTKYGQNWNWASKVRS